MKRKVSLLLIVLISLSSGISFAQTTTTHTATATTRKKHKKNITVKKRTEKIVINDSSNKTVVEVKNGKIYVDGNVVSSIKNAKNEDHKIVINHKKAGAPGHPHHHGRKEEDADNNDLPKPSDDDANKDVAATNKIVDRMLHDEQMGQPEHRAALLGVYTNPGAPVEGAYISGVMRNSPAQNAGLMEGDVIVKINETNIDGTPALINTIGNYTPGDQINITYDRNGNTQQANVQLTDKAGFTAQQQSNENNYGQQFHHYRNEANNEQDNQPFSNKPIRLGIDASDGRRPRGVYLEKVKPNSPAREAGLQEGDIITRINGERVRYAYEMQELLSFPRMGNTIYIQYRHNGHKMNTVAHINNNR